MIITVASYKGGVGKTTTAVHLAAFLSRSAPTLLVDGDENRSATAWASKGLLPFTVAGERQAVKLRPSFEHLVIDTQARPALEDLKDLALGCDLLIIPTTPDMLALHALDQTLAALKAMGAEVKFRVLLTIVPPKPNRDAEDARAELKQQSIPVFKRAISQFVAYKKAALAGTTVRDLRADRMAAVAWSQYEEVGEELK